MATEARPDVDLTQALAAASGDGRARLVRAAGELLARGRAAGVLQEIRCEDEAAAPDGGFALCDRDPRNA